MFGGDICDIVYYCLVVVLVRAGAAANLLRTPVAVFPWNALKLSGVVRQGQPIIGFMIFHFSAAHFNRYWIFNLCV